MDFHGLPPQSEHLPDPAPVAMTRRWLSIDAAAGALGWRAEHVRGTWDRLVAETWSTGGALAGGTPVRMALCSDGFLDAWCMDARDLPSFRKEFSDLEAASAAAFRARRTPEPAGPMTKEWLTFGQVAKHMGSSQRNASITAFWISVTSPEGVDRRAEPYMRGVRLSLRRHTGSGQDLWALRADVLDLFGDAYLAALRSHTPRKASVRQPGELSCEEGWALFGRTLHWGAYFHAWHGRQASQEPTYKTLAGAFAVARAVANRHSAYGSSHTPISVFMNHVERDLRPTVRKMLKEFEEAGTEGAIGPLGDVRQVVCTTYVDGVPLPSVADEFKDRFLDEARRRLSVERALVDEPGPSLGM